MEGIRRLARRLAVDRAVAYTLLGQMWSVLAGPLSVFLIARCLSIEEQGFYYTFGSLLALQMFFELGLTTLLVTFAAHEKALLVWTDTGELRGEPQAELRLSGLLQSSVRWYTVLACGFTLVCAPLGFWFFFRGDNGLAAGQWVVPWLGVVATTALNLMIVPFIAVLEGCGLIRETSLARLRQTIVSNAVFWGVLLAGGGLLAAFLSALFGWTVLASWIFGYRKLLREMLRYPAGEGQINWRKEVWPLQWKLALSWVSGYFIFQLFTPILFLYHGPAAAGRMGMSLNLVNRISALAQTWMAMKVPTFASLAGSRRYSELDRLFLRSTIVSTCFAVLLGGSLWLIAVALRLSGSNFATRLLEPATLALLVIAMLIAIINNCETMYMRAHKEEPLVYVWVVSALIIAAAAYYFGRSSGAFAMMASYCLLMFVICTTVVTPIFVRRWTHYHVTERQKNS